MKNLRQITYLAALTATILGSAGSARLLADPIPFAQSAGGGILVGSNNYSTQSGSPMLSPTYMMGLQFDGTYDLPVLDPITGIYVAPPPDDWADIFGEQGQFRFELNTKGNVEIKDLNAPTSWNPDPAGTSEWAIQNVQGQTVMNSIMRGTVQSISLNTLTGHFEATLATDGYFHWYYGAGVTSFQSWGLDGLVYVSGDLVQEGNFYHNNVDNRLHFSFGVPDTASTFGLIGLGLMGMLCAKFGFRRK